MKTSFPKDRIKAVLFEKPHERGDEVLTAEGFQVQRVDAAGGPLVLGPQSYAFVVFPEAEAPACP